MEDGIFLSSNSDLLFQLDPQLEKIARRLPRNVKYTFSMLQNNVLEVYHSWLLMFSGVGKESEESGSETFNLHDKMEIVDLRYWKGYQVEEHTITVQIYLESEESDPCQTGSW